MFNNASSHLFHGGHFEIGHNDKLLNKSLINHLISTAYMFLNQIILLTEVFVQNRIYAHELFLFRKYCLLFSRRPSWIGS